MERADSLSSMATVINSSSPKKSLRKRALGGLRISLPKAILDFFDSRLASPADTGRERARALAEEPEMDGGSARTSLKTTKSFFGSARSNCKSLPMDSGTPTHGSNRVAKYRGRVSDTSKSLRDKFRRSLTRDDPEIEEEHHSSPIPIPDAPRDLNALHRSIPFELPEKPDNPLRRRMLNSPGAQTTLSCSKSLSPCSPDAKALSPMPGATFRIDDVDQQSLPFEEAFDNMSNMRNVSTTDQLATEYRKTLDAFEPYDALIPANDPFVDPAKQKNTHNSRIKKILRARSGTYDSGYASDTRQIMHPLNTETKLRSNGAEVDNLNSRPPFRLPRILRMDMTARDADASTKPMQTITAVACIESQDAANDTLKEVVSTNITPPSQWTDDARDEQPACRGRSRSAIEYTTIPRRAIVEQAGLGGESPQIFFQARDTSTTSVRHVYEGTFFGSRTQRPLRKRHTFTNLMRVGDLGKTGPHDQHVPYSPRSLIITPSALRGLRTVDSSVDSDETTGPSVPLRYWKRPQSLSESSEWLSTTTVDIDEAMDEGHEDGGRLWRTWRLPSPVPDSDDGITNGSLD